MHKTPEYFIILIILLVLSIFLQRQFSLKIYTSFRHGFLFNVGMVLVTIVWDNYAIARGHWSFGEQFLLGPRIGFMPIEEFGFILVGSYFGLVLFKIVAKYAS